MPYSPVAPFRHSRPGIGPELGEPYARMPDCTQSPSVSPPIGYRVLATLTLFDHLVVSCNAISRNCHTRARLRSTRGGPSGRAAERQDGQPPVPAAMRTAQGGQATARVALRANPPASRRITRESANGAGSWREQRKRKYRPRTSAALRSRRRLHKPASNEGGREAARASRTRERVENPEAMPGDEVTREPGAAGGNLEGAVGLPARAT